MADLRIDSSLFTIFFALGRYSLSIYKKTKQCGLNMKGPFGKCVGEKIAFYRAIGLKADCLSSHPSSMLAPILIGDYYVIVAWLLLFLHQQNS